MALYACSQTENVLACIGYAALFNRSKHEGFEFSLCLIGTSLLPMSQSLYWLMLGRVES